MMMMVLVAVVVVFGGDDGVGCSGSSISLSRGEQVVGVVLRVVVMVVIW